MNSIKCPKCGKEEPAFDYAHICGPVKVKTKMNGLIKEFERKCWDHQTNHLNAEKFAELIVRECGDVAYSAYWANPEMVRGQHIKQKIKQHFGVEE